MLAGGGGFSVGRIAVCAVRAGIHPSPEIPSPLKRAMGVRARALARLLRSGSGERFLIRYLGAGLLGRVYHTAKTIVHQKFVELMGRLALLPALGCVAPRPLMRFCSWVRSLGRIAPAPPSGGTEAGSPTPPPATEVGVGWEVRRGWRWGAERGSGP